MIHTLTSQIRQYKRDSFLAPLFTMLESVMELTIPLMMASIIDDGINTGEMSTVYRVGAMMLVAAALCLLFGILAGKFAANAATGFSCNLRDAMFANIQRFSFSNIDKYSTAGLVTRLTTDVTQCAECLSDGLAHVCACAGDDDLCAFYGVFDQ